MKNNIFEKIYGTKLNLTLEEKEEVLEKSIQLGRILYIIEFLLLFGVYFIFFFDAKLAFWLFLSINVVILYLIIPFEIALLRRKHKLVITYQTKGDKIKDIFLTTVFFALISVAITIYFNWTKNHMVYIDLPTLIGIIIGSFLLGLTFTHPNK